jgi:hypothetical protein
MAKRAWRCSPSSSRSVARLLAQPAAGSAGFVRGGNDTNASHTVTLQVACLAP